MLFEKPATAAIFAIDPGTTESGWVMFSRAGRVLEADICSNSALLSILRHSMPDNVEAVVIEMIGHYGTGMAPGKEVYDTCVWIGRFIEAWGGHFELVKRQAVKLHLCGSARAKDPNVRAALIDRLGAPGTKKAPGATYGIRSHLWAALGVAVAYADGVR